MCECLFNEDGSGFLCEACAPEWQRFEERGGMLYTMALQHLIKRGASVIVWEGDNGRCFFVDERIGEPPDTSLLADHWVKAIDLKAEEIIQQWANLPDE
jgi:hypothetical protein